MSNFEEMFQAACNRARRKGYGDSFRGKHKVVVEGEYRQLMTFVNLEHRINGVVTCYYYNSEIFAIDFINKRITNFKMERYSISTSRNISTWEWVFRTKYDHERKWHGYSFWTGGHEAYGANVGDFGKSLNTMYDRFCAKVPWVYFDGNGIHWFAWDKYDMSLASEFFESRTFLYNKQNWRYFDYNWDEQGRWTRRFKNADAEKRWHKREKRHLAMRKAA